MAVGDAIAEKVRGGQMTDAEAKAALGEALVRGEAAFEASKPQVVGPSTTNCQRIGDFVNCQTY